MPLIQKLLTQQLDAKVADSLSKCHSPAGHRHKTRQLEPKQTHTQSEHEYGQTSHPNGPYRKIFVCGDDSSARLVGKAGLLCWPVWQLTAWHARLVLVAVHSHRHYSSKRVWIKQAAKGGRLAQKGLFAIYTARGTFVSWSRLSSVCRLRFFPPPRNLLW